MVTPLAWACGLAMAGAVLLGLQGLRRRPTGTARPATARPGSAEGILPARWAGRAVAATVAGAALGLLTRWPVLMAAGGVAAFFGKELLSPRSARQASIERTEAVAAWAEQLRDTMAAAAGLQQAIVATAPLSPSLVRAAVGRAAAKASREPLVPVLLALADDLADPTADLVVTSLVLAASGDGQDLATVLSTVAAAARADAAMRRHVDASRARTRTAVRTITAIALITLVGLLLLGHGYLRPYSTSTGQLVLAVVLGLYGCGVALLHRMGRDKPTERFLRPSRGIRP